MALVLVICSRAFSESIHAFDTVSYKLCPKIIFQLVFNRRTNRWADTTSNVPQFFPFPFPGIDLFSVAAHQLGHSLGLGHSDVHGSFMYPWYQGRRDNSSLPPDEAKAIIKLYGTKDKPLVFPATTTTTTTTTTTMTTTTTSLAPTTPETVTTKLSVTPKTEKTTSMENNEVAPKMEESVEGGNGIVKEIDVEGEGGKPFVEEGKIVVVDVVLKLLFLFYYLGKNIRRLFEH